MVPGALFSAPGCRQGARPGIQERRNAIQRRTGSLPTTGKGSWPLVLHSPGESTTSGYMMKRAWTSPPVCLSRAIPVIPERRWKSRSKPQGLTTLQFIHTSQSLCILAKPARDRRMVRRPALKREHRDRRAFRTPFFRRVARQGVLLLPRLKRPST